ncbi:hypothetical protein Bca4012_080702 [Brassica carinata]
MAGLLIAAIDVCLKAGAHHRDLMGATKDDPELLQQHRRQEVAIAEKMDH